MPQLCFRSPVLKSPGWRRRPSVNFWAAHTSSQEVIELVIVEAFARSRVPCQSANQNQSRIGSAECSGAVNSNLRHQFTQISFYACSVLNCWQTPWLGWPGWDSGHLSGLQRWYWCSHDSYSIWLYAYDEYLATSSTGSEVDCYSCKCFRCSSWMCISSDW